MAAKKRLTVNQKLLDKYIRHAIYVEQLKTSEARRLSNFLRKETFPQIYKKLISELSKVKNIETLGSAFKIKRLKSMLASVQKISLAGSIKAEKNFESRLEQISKFEAAWNKKEIMNTVPLDIDFAMPSNKVLKNLVTSNIFEGHKLSSWMKAYSKSVQKTMAKSIKVGVSTGESLPKIGKRITKALNINRKQAESIARTAVSSVVHSARDEVFKENSDLIRGIQWVATLDDRTTLTCINLDGRIFEEGEGERPPAHFNCRSTTIPVIKSWQEYGVEDPPPATKASMNGAVSEKTTYKQWLKDQPKSVQDKVLGKTKAELYRSGRVKIDKFVGKDYKPLTLKQIAKREKINLTQEITVKGKEIKTIPIKGTGKVLIKTEIDAVEKYVQDNYSSIRDYQLGKSISNPKEIKSQIESMDSALNKLSGYEGVTYRGLNFGSKEAKQKFLSEFNKNEIWQSKTFQSTSKDKSIAKMFVHDKPKGVLLKIKGKSGRDLSTIIDEQYANIEKEVLFKANTPFKVINVKDDVIFLEEITEATQELRVFKNTKFKFKNIKASYGEELSTEFDRLIKKFPAANKRLSEIEMLPPKEYKRVTGLNGTACVKQIDGKDKIFFNGEVFLENSKYDAAALTKRLADKGEIVGERIADHAIHEFGHVVENSLAKSKRDKIFDFLWDADEKTLRQIRKQISKYAAENSSELFAESFTQWQIGKASPMAKKVLRMAGLI